MFLAGPGMHGAGPQKMLVPNRTAWVLLDRRSASLWFGYNKSLGAANLCSLIHPSLVVYFERKIMFGTGKLYLLLQDLTVILCLLKRN